MKLIENKKGKALIILILLFVLIALAFVIYFLVLSPIQSPSSEIPNTNIEDSLRYTNYQQQVTNTDIIGNPPPLVPES